MNWRDTFAAIMSYTRECWVDRMLEIGHASPRLASPPPSLLGSRQERLPVSLWESMCHPVLGQGRTPERGFGRGNISGSPFLSKRSGNQPGWSSSWDITGEFLKRRTFSPDPEPG